MSIRIDYSLIPFLLLVVGGFVARMLYLSRHFSRKERIIWYTVTGTIILALVIWGVIKGR
jgi:hypothetical protein